MAPPPAGAVASPPRVAATAHTLTVGYALGWGGGLREDAARVFAGGLRGRHLYDQSGRIVEPYRLDVFHLDPSRRAGAHAWDLVSMGVNKYR